MTDKSWLSLFKQAQDMQSKVSEIQEGLADKTVEVSTGGGMVTVVMNGAKQIMKLTIDPEVVSKEDVDMLQDLIVAAVNDAQRKVDETVTNQMGGLMGGLKMPGLMG